MRIKVTKTKVYKFADLPDNIQDKAIDNLADINVSFEWWDSIYDDAANVGIKITSFNLDRGSYCRGDFLESAEDVAHLIQEQHGTYSDTFKTSVQYIKGLYRIKHDIPLDENGETTHEFEGAKEAIDRQFFRNILEDYRVLLQKEYEYLTSREAIIETIEANGYEFNEHGKIA